MNAFTFTPAQSAGEAQSYLHSFLTACAYPPEAVACLCTVHQTLAACPPAYTTLQHWLQVYQSENGFTMDYPSANREIEAAATAAEVHPYTALLVFYCLLTQPLWIRYQLAGYSREVFDETVLDLRYKATECNAVHGVWGLFVAHWYAGFFALTRFALGRLQYEIIPLPEACTLNGVYHEKGVPALNIHIPSAGSLAPALCDASLALARAFFPPEPQLFVCTSWLLFPPNEQLLADSKNILHFMRRFQILKTTPTALDEDMWRIFGQVPKPPFTDIPCHTSLQRAYAAWLRKGNAPGMGLGVFAR